MNCADALTVLNIIIAIIGLMFVLITIYEFWRLRKIRSEFENLKQQLRADNLTAQKAMHRIVASYAITDPHEKLKLLDSAAQIDATAFNLYNSMGYAWLDLEQNVRAANAFREAVRLHPDDKAGYFDLAYAYLLMKEEALALENLEQAVKVDPSSAQDLKDNPQFKALHGEARYQRLVKASQSSQ